MNKENENVFVAVLALGVSGPAAWAYPVVWDVYEGEGIQDAIDGAADGDTIYVHTGTYDESIVIDGKDLSLIAVGDVLLQPTEPCLGHRDVIQVYNSVATIKGFTLDANYSVSTCLGGIYAKGGCEDSGAVDITVKDNEISNYGKNGITVNCELATAKITGNTVTGRGELPLGDYAQNGIQLGWGATGEVRDNTITDHWYLCSKRDAAQGLCTAWWAAGLLLYDVEPAFVKHAKSDNTFMRNQFDVLVVSSQSLE
jgi:hypothetical protein